MAINKQNLRVPTSEQARINGAKGGKASAKAKEQRKRMTDVMQSILNGLYIQGDGTETSGTEMMFMTLFQIAVDKRHKQCISAIRLIREITGEDISPEKQKEIEKKLELIDKQIELTEIRKKELDW